MLKVPSQDAAENAIQALRESNFKKFFQCLEQITDKRQQTNLIVYAVKIAAEQKAVQILELLAEKWVMLCDEPYNSPLGDIIQKLVALSQPEGDAAAISITTLYAQSNQSYGASLWLILCQALLAKQKFDKVKMLYRFLESDQEKREVANGVLEKIKLADNFPIWFEWFARYLQTIQSYNYYSNENFGQQAIDFILAYSAFSQLLPHIIISPINKTRENFITKLFFQLLLSQKTEKIAMLSEKLPASLIWLRNVYQSLNNESAFVVFESAEFLAMSYEVQAGTINLALGHFIARQNNSTAEVMGKLFLESIQQFFWKKDALIEKFCEICCQQRRHDVALYLLKNTITPEHAEFKTVAALVVGIKLSNEDYRFIVQRLDAWPDDIKIVAQLEQREQENRHYRLYGSYTVRDTISVLVKIPRDIVLTENVRRIQLEAEQHALRKQQKIQQQAELRKQLIALPDNSISQRHGQYLELIEQINFYLTEAQPQFALILIKKIVSSGYKDEYVKRVALLFFAAQQIKEAQEACDLLKHTSTQWKEWPQKVQSNKYQKTLEWLLGGESFAEVKVLVQYYVSKIFAQNSAATAFDILFSSKLFTEKQLNLETYYSDKAPNYFNNTTQGEDTTEDDDSMWTDEDSDMISVTSGVEHKVEEQSLEEMIIGHFIVQYADSKKLIKKMGELKDAGVTGFETAILHYHLQRRQWANAVRLINLFADNQKNIQYCLSYNDTLTLLEKTAVDYFKAKTTLTVATVNQIRQIASMDLRARTFFVLLAKAPANLYQDNNLIKLIVATIGQLVGLNYQFELFDALFKNLEKAATPQGIIVINDIIVKGVENSDLKNRFFVQYILMAVIYNPVLAREINGDYWRTRAPFWYAVITQAVTVRQGATRNAVALLRYIFDNRSEWDTQLDMSTNSTIQLLCTWTVEQCLCEKTMLFDVVRLLCAEFKTDSEKNYWTNNYFIQKLYLPCIAEISRKAQQDPALILPLLEHFEQVLPISQTTSQKTLPFTEIMRFVEIALNDSIRVNHAPAIKLAFVFILERTKTYYSQFTVILSKALTDIIKNRQTDLVEGLGLLAISTDYASFENSFSNNGLLSQICDYFISSNTIKKVLPFLNAVELSLDNSMTQYKSSFKDKKVKIIIKVVERLASEGAMEQVHLLYQDNLKLVRRDLLAPLLDILVNNNKLIFVRKIIEENGGEPQQILVYRKRIVTQHFVRLATLIDDEYANKMKEYYMGFVQFLHQKDSPDLAQKACGVRNQLIVGLKNLLDKAFRAYYQKAEGKDPPMVYGKLCNFPVPVNDSFKGKKPEDKLNNFIAEFKINAMSPELYQYLVQIQPALDPSYEWLNQLRKMRNDETHHESFLPQVVQVDGTLIDIPKFLVDALTGIEKILIKLFHNKATQDQLDGLCLNSLVPLTTESMHAAAHALGVEQNFIVNDRAIQVAPKK